MRKNKQAAMMFDYNLMGKGYRSSDFRNVCSSMSEEAGEAFVHVYECLYLDKHGCTRQAEAHIEECIDAVVAPLYALIAALVHAELPYWAESSK